MTLILIEKIFYRSFQILLIKVQLEADDQQTTSSCPQILCHLVIAIFGKR